MSVTVDIGLLNHIALHFTHRKTRLKKQHQIYNIQHLTTPLNHWFKVYSIDTPLRVAHFLAQACCETFQFTSMTEHPAYGGKEYDAGTRAGYNLGNKFPGDGPKYIGRGMLDLTGRGNYQSIGKAIGSDLVNYPKTVATDFSLAVRTACEYWKIRGLNAVADLDDFHRIMLRINGGMNGQKERYAALQRAKKYLHIS
jgi:putative chitinase